MITNDLQNRIHFGDREAFLAIYQEYGRGVYTVARNALSSDSLAKSAVKQTFLTLYEEILTKMDDFDIPVRIRELADHEIYLLRLLDGRSNLMEDAGVPLEEVDPEQFSARAFANNADLVINLPSLEWERSFRKPRKGLFLRKPKKIVTKQPPLIWKLLLVLIDLFLLWILVGLLMGMGFLPAVDLGYAWFSRILSSITLNLS